MPPCQSAGDRRLNVVKSTRRFWDPRLFRFRIYAAGQPAQRRIIQSGNREQNSRGSGFFGTFDPGTFRRIFFRVFLLGNFPHAKTENCRTTLPKAASKKIPLIFSETLMIGPRCARAQNFYGIRSQSFATISGFVSMVNFSSRSTRNPISRSFASGSFPPSLVSSNSLRLLISGSRRMYSCH